jgi:hypothetical protein
VFKLRSEVGTDTIGALERSFIQRALARLAGQPNLEIVGGTGAERLAILSLRFFHRGTELHHGFVVSLLNDLFGIQARGGCSCAGPYGHSLLGLDPATSDALDAAMQRGHGILRPGWVRLGFNYFIDEMEFEFLLAALELVAEHGWRLLPQYHYCPRRGVWQHRSGAVAARPSLEGWCFAGGELPAPLPAPAPTLAETLEAARQVLQQARGAETVADPVLDAGAEALRWFLTPGEAASHLAGERAA